MQAAERLLLQPPGLSARDGEQPDDLGEDHLDGPALGRLGFLAELQPEGFAEIGTELAASLGISNGDWMVISTARGAVETKALVTDRVPPLTVAGRRLHQVGMPWHFGYEGLAKGAIANDLTTLVEDPDSMIHEAKALTCAVWAGRLHG